MNILFLSRSNSGKPHPFIEEQANVLARNFNLNIYHFLINEGGLNGYVGAVINMIDFIKKQYIEIIHVHYGLWGFVAILNKLLFQHKCKIIITYHGSDINKTTERKISLLASKFAAHNILVSEKMKKYFQNNYSIIPCGIDTNIKLNARELTRLKNGWATEDFIVLFSSCFTREEKDPDFAFKVIKAFRRQTNKNVKFIELKGFNREQMTGIMQAADALIMCSKREGSPQIIKEAILNSLPVISNDIGDVSSICSGVDHCFIISKEIDAYVNCLKSLSENKPRIENRYPIIKNYDNNLVAERLFGIYKRVLMQTKPLAEIQYSKQT